MTLFRRHNKLLVFVLALAVIGGITLLHAQAPAVSPFMGVGNVQFFDNYGNVLSGGMLYTYQAGTTTQQATYTDSTGTTQNPDPVPLSSGARATIWLLSQNFYKFVLCTQNDGATCASGDVLFSVDNVPGSSSSGGGSGTANLLISSSPSPATTGIIRMASGDTICWRNAAGSANLCFSKDANDILEWSGGSIKFPEISPPPGGGGFDILWADSAAHRWMMKNNAGVGVQVVGSGVDVNTSDQVTQLHFGSAALPLNPTTPPATNQFLQWDGAHISGGAPVIPPQVPTVLANYYVTMTGGDVSLTSSTATTILTQAVTMPASGCPCRAVISYQIYWTSNNVTFDSWVGDGTRAIAQAQSTGPNAVTGAIGASQVSQATYGNSAAVTFTLQIESSGSGATARQSAANNPSGITPQPSWLSVSIVSSN